MLAIETVDKAKRRSWMLRRSYEGCWRAGSSVTIYTEYIYTTMWTEKAGIRAGTARSLLRWWRVEEVDAILSSAISLVCQPAARLRRVGVRGRLHGFHVVVVA